MFAIKIGRWWYPARRSIVRGRFEVYYPTKNPTWQDPDTVREALNQRTKRRLT